MEVRVPFLDHRLIEYTAPLPDEAKIQEGRGSSVVRKLMEHQLPSSISDRKKQGFNHPVDHWFRGRMRNFVYGLLSLAIIRRRDLFHPGTIGKIQICMIGENGIMARSCTRW